MIKKFCYFALLNLQVVLAISTPSTVSAQNQDSCSSPVIEQAVAAAGISNRCNVLGEYLDAQNMITAAVKFCQKARSNNKEKSQALQQCLRLQANAYFVFLKSQIANGSFSAAGDIANKVKGAILDAARGGNLPSDESTPVPSASPSPKPTDPSDGVGDGHNLPQPTIPPDPTKKPEPTHVPEQPKPSPIATAIPSASPSPNNDAVKRLAYLVEMVKNECGCDAAAHPSQIDYVNNCALHSLAIHGASNDDRNRVFQQLFGVLHCAGGAGDRK